MVGQCTDGHRLRQTDDGLSFCVMCEGWWGRDGAQLFHAVQTPKKKKKRFQQNRDDE